MNLRRRRLALLLAAVAVQIAGCAQDPLPSWNDGPAKQAIVSFVRATTDASSPQFVPPRERIATFDQDGTLWVEKPVVPQLMYCLDRVGALAKEKPELNGTEPFKTVLSGDRAALAKLSKKDLEKILAATLAGMTTDEFEAEVKQWLAAAKHPRWRRPYTELTYQPMQEVLKYLRTTATRPTSSPAAARTSCAFTPSRPTASRRSRWSGPWPASSSAMARTASRS